MMEPALFAINDPTSIPFMLMAGSPTAVQINRTRVIEAGITAVITGMMISAAGYYVAFPVLQNQVSNIAFRQNEQNAQVLEILKEFKHDRQVIDAKRDAEIARLQAQLLEVQLKLARQQR
jgi:hypothetical protein